MSGKQYVARSPQIAARMMGDEMMIMSAVDSTLFTLNDVATAIWNAADGSNTLEEIVVEKVCEQFEVTHETGMKDAEELVARLAEHEILIVSDHPVAQAAAAAKGNR
jgi:hypothetical protein